MLGEGDQAPDVTLTLAGGDSRPLSAWRGKPLVLYFYPKDDTPGCTSEAQDFTARLEEFETAGAAVVGVSRDSAAKHRKFIDKYALRHALAADEDGQVCEAFGTWVEKSMYGRSYMGIERATFLIDAAGRVARVWPKVKVKGHADEVLDAVRTLA